jgi:hypothetical protein
MRYTRIVNEIKLSQVVHSRHKESVDFVLNWKPGQKVPNPRYIEYKNDVSSAFRVATHKLDGANVYTVWDAQRKDGEEPLDKYSFPSSVLHVPGFLKRAPKQLKRIKSRNAIKLIKEAITALKPWVEIAENLKAMKGDVVKRQVGVGAGNKPTAANIGALSKEIEDELEKIGKGFRKELEKTFVKNYENMVSKYEKDAERVGSTNTYRIYRDKSNYHLNTILSKFLTMIDNTGGGTYEVAKDVKSRIDKRAKADATDAVESFVLKMKIKLLSIVGSRKLAVDVDGDHTKNTITFEFEDKSGFTVRNNIVLSFSMYGKPFYRYPTTFHNVTIPGGEAMRSPSESKVKKAFAK